MARDRPLRKLDLAVEERIRLSQLVEAERQRELLDEAIAAMESGLRRQAAWTRYLNRRGMARQDLESAARAVCREQKRVEREVLPGLEGLIRVIRE